MLHCVVKEFKSIRNGLTKKGKFPHGVVNPLQGSECWKVAQMD